MVLAVSVRVVRVMYSIALTTQCYGNIKASLRPVKHLRRTQMLVSVLSDEQIDK